ncbi:hypothetical protein AB0V79_01900 [Mesorhizobium ciceri]|uniref:hypothetical protein n=1 Tax=Mesorhizobium ciceri TaxID=39645 RepID=UPI0007A94448|nr:hypothetical protein [Mesorhizobium ciceri]AMY01285.1 hypothetical protein A4R29_18590 [Mesorhizobium ciceri biovar biserrulae]
MFMKILAASALTIGLATSAMAQSNGTSGTDGSGGSGKSVTVDPNTPASPNTVDPGTTNSTTAAPGATNSNADENCPAHPQGAQPDASGTSPGTTAPTVNDNHCGK